MTDYLKFLKKDSFSIFLFHGVVPNNNFQVRNYNKKHISKDFFVSFIKNISKVGSPVTMNEIIFANKNKQKLPPYSFAITFDDGFENNYNFAAPILDNFKVPATFYVATNFINNNVMSWIDQIELVVENIKHNFIKMPWGKYEIINNRSSKIKFLESVRFNVKNNPNIDPFEIVNIIYDQLNLKVIQTHNDLLTKMMSWDQLDKLNNNEFFTIGGHSHSHAILSFLKKQEMEREVKLSLKFLWEKGKIKTNHYSYPEGLANSYNQDVIKVLKKNNILCSPSAIHGTNNIYTNLFKLRRINVI